MAAMFKRRIGNALAAPPGVKKKTQRAKLLLNKARH